MVVGSITVNCGVFTAGVFGPKAAIDDGQNTRSGRPASPRSRATSRMLRRPSMFKVQAFNGACSPVADSRAASWYTWVTASSATSCARRGLSSTSSWT